MQLGCRKSMDSVMEARKRCSHFPPLGVNEWKLQVRYCPDQVLCCPAEKEISSKTGAHGLFNTYQDVPHLQNIIAVRKTSKIPKESSGWTPLPSSLR